VNHRFNWGGPVVAKCSVCAQRLEICHSETGCRMPTQSRMGSRRFCGAEINIFDTGQPHRCRANGHSRAYVGGHGARNARPMCGRKLPGWRGLPARLFVAYWNVSVAVLGRHGGIV
jgi:hypothetical protein